MTELRHLVTDGDGAVGEDVGVQAGAMGQLLDDPRPRQRLKVGARLAQLDAVTDDVADAELPPDELVQRHSAHGQLTARGAAFDLSACCSAV
jgi:hypothetical protein